MKRTFRLLCTVFSLFLFTTCTVGLGSVVDTREPDLTISYPPESAIIKDSFVLAGTCSDDTGVSAIKVKLTNTDTKKIYGPLDAEVDGETWSITLNNEGDFNGYEYEDGRYLIDAWAVDSVNRESGITSRTFDIDNTAPVLYLSKPLSKGNDPDITTFGKQLKISGEISESHITESMTVYFREYDVENSKFSDGDEIDITITGGVEISPDVPLMIARYYSNDEANDDNKKSMRDNYLKLFPGVNLDNETPKDKVFYCSFELTDNTKVYQTPGDNGSGTGNISERYFINSMEFTNSLVSENAYGLSADNMRKFINGTSSYDTVQKDLIKNILETHSGYYVDTVTVDDENIKVTENSSKFIINPNNNPTYKIENFDITTNDSRTSLSSGASFPLEIASGKDSILVKAKTIKVVIESDDQSAGKPVFSKTYIYNSVDEDGNNIVIPDGGEVWGTSDDTVLRKQITVKKEDGLVDGKRYHIIVTGKDRDGNPIEPANGNADESAYGFVLSSTSTPPTVRIDESLKGKYYSAKDIKEKGLTIPVKVTVDGISFIDSSKGNSIANSIRIQKTSDRSGKLVERSVIQDELKNLVTKNSIGNYPAELKVVKPAAITQNGNTYSFDLKIGGDSNSVNFNTDKGVFKYSFYVMAIDSNNKTGSDVFTFYIDNEDPSIGETSVSLSESDTKLIEKTGDSSNKWINGEVYVKAKFHDNYGLGETRYWVYSHDTTGDTLVEGGTEGISCGSGEDATIKIDTTASAFAPRISGSSKVYKQLKIKFKTTDSVGNEIESSTTFGNTYIDQETDKPVIEGGNFVLDFEIADFGKDESDVSKNIFGSGSNLIGKISDDDGIAAGSTVTIKQGGNQISRDEIGDSESFNIKLPKDSGLYTVTFDIKDTTYETSSEENKIYRSTTKSTVIAIDNSVPTITETEVDTEDVRYVKDSTVRFAGTVKDDLILQETKYPTVSVLKNGIQVALFEKSENYSYDFDASSEAEGSYTFEFVATDMAGKSSTVTRTICKDATPPVFATTSEDKPRITTTGSTAGGVTWYSTQTINIKGHVSDNASGVDVVEYTLDNGQTWKAFSGTTLFEEAITGIKDRTEIKIRATDLAGNSTSAISLGTIRLDNVRPTLSASQYTNDNSSAADAEWKDIEGEIVSNGKKNISIRGLAKDETSVISGTSGIAKVNIKCGTNSFTNPDVVVTTFSEGVGDAQAWTAVVPAGKLDDAFKTSGSGKIWAQVVDNAGLTYEVPIVSIKYDSQYPEAKITSVVYYDTETPVVEANKKIVIKGSAKDNQTLKSLKIQYSLKGSSNWNDLDVISGEIYSWNYTVDTEDKTKFTDGNTYLFRAIAEDDAGNIGNSYEAVSGTAINSGSDYCKEIKINQDSDRPVIKISNLEFASGKSIQTMNADIANHAHLYNSNRVYISVTDDDGTPSSVAYRIGNEWKFGAKSYYTKNAVPVAGDSLYKDSGCFTPAKNDTDKSLLTVTSYTAKNGSTAAYISINGESGQYRSTEDDPSSWTIISGDNFTIPKEGPQTIIFRVTDNQKTEFVSSAAINGKEVGPKLQNLEGKSSSSKDTRLYIDVDMTGPETNDSKTEISSAVNNVYRAWKKDLSEEKFGGDYKKFRLSLEVKDSCGVESVELSQESTSYKGKCQDTDYFDGDDHVWIINDIDVSTIATGKTQFVLKLTDKAGNSNESYINIDIDNSPALLGIESHSDNELISTAFILKGYVTDSDSETVIKYYTSSNPTRDDSKWASASELLSNGGIFRLNVDGRTSAYDGETHTEVYKKLFVDAYGATEKIEYNDDKLVVYSQDVGTHKKGDKYLETKTLYFHFYVTDRVGNKSYKTLPLTIDPQGDIPTVDITYPVYPKAGTVSEIDKFSGKVRAQGKATVKGDNKIVGVYIQIDPEVSGTNPSFDGSKWKGTSLSVVQNKVLCANGSKLSSVLPNATTNPIENIYYRYNQKVTSDAAKTSDMYAIYVGDSAAWNYSINTNGELDKANGTNTIGLRVYVVDSSGNINILKEENDVFITLDADAPQIGTDTQLYLWQYSWVNGSDTYYSKTATPAAGEQLYVDSGCRTPATGKTWSAAYTDEFASKDYKYGMSIKGEWWLQGSATDSNGIKTLKIYSEDDKVNGYDILTDNSCSSKKVLSVKNSSGTVIRTGYEFTYRVGSTESEEAGTLSYEIFAQENTDSASEARYPISVSFDNKKPVLNKDDGNFNINSNVINNYGFYTLSASAYETGIQSGFDKVVVYFKRPSNNTVYDTYLAKSVTENAQVYEGAGKSLEEKDDHLYWKEGSVVANGISGSVVQIAAHDKNIHKGGLVKFGGTYYLIKAYDSVTKKVTLDGNPSVNLAGSKIYFAIGNVIDTVGTESTGTLINSNPVTAGYGYYIDSLDNEDDYMIESTITSNGKTIWSASVNSNNIPDGPIQIHYVVFDKAGNSVHDYVDAVVKNNNPRLASVRVWCDFDGDGVENADGSESDTYYYQKKERYETFGVPMSVATGLTENLVVSGNNKDADNGGTAFMTVKNAVTFIPEIIGGNNDLYYGYEWKSGNTVKKSGYSTNSFGKGHDDNIDEISDSSGYLKNDYYGDSYIKGSTSYVNSSNKEVEYRIPVTVAELESIGNSATNGTSIVPTWFNYTIYDSTEGCASWSDSTKTNGRHSAMFKVALNVQYIDTKAPVVGIDKFYWNSKTDNSLYKNSSDNGHIELEDDIAGTAIPTTKTTATTPVALGNDPKVSGKITIRGTAEDDIGLASLAVRFPGMSGTKSITNQLVAATYADGVWTSVSPDTPENMVANGWTFTVTKNENTQEGHKVEWECNIDTSYVSGVASLDRVFTLTATDARGKNGTKTGLTASQTYQMDVVPYIKKITTSLTKEQNGIYARTALGHYSVYNNETVTLSGFNFAKGNTDVNLGIGNTRASGEYSYYKSNIPALNNLNKDVEYNMQPNGVTNNLMNDDIYFDVWEIKNKAVSPMDNYILNMSMAVNQQSGMVNFAFNNGAYNWSMAKGTASSYEKLYANTDGSDFTRCSSFTVDANGNTYGGVLWGGEGKPYSLFSSRWGGSSLSIGANSIPAQQDKDRYQGISYASLVNASNTTNLYMAFMDNIQGGIYLKYGVMQGTTPTANGTFTNDMDQYITRAIKICEPAESSEYLSVGVTQNNTVVVVWYDGGKLMYKFGQFSYNATTETLTPPTSWTTVSDLALKAGKFCALAVDNADGIHIAYSDTFKNDLKYIYLSNVNPNTAGVVKKIATVDSYLTVGQNITIDVAQTEINGTNYQIPYIGYFAATPQRPRYAYIADPQKFYGTSNIDGTIADKYTGVWECKVIPSASTIFIDDNTPWNVNVGVWKNKNTLKKNNSGVLTNSTTGTAAGGKVYGNGTSNAVVSYLVNNPSNPATNYGETAQLK